MQNISLKNLEDRNIYLSSTREETKVWELSTFSYI